MKQRHFTDDQKLFRSAYREFIKREISPNMEKWREQGIVDREAFLKAGENGFLMIWPDEEYGGLGDNDFRFDQIIIEETCYTMTDDWGCEMHNRMCGPYISLFGSEEQKKRILPKCVSGEIILALAITEPSAGSDVSGIRTTAKDMGDHYLLNGSKIYISNGINADMVIVAAKTDPKNNPRTMGLFLVERGMPGFDRGNNLKKLGMKAQDTAELFFNNVKIPKENVLGDPSKGFAYMMNNLAEERLINSCRSIAIAQKAFDITVDFVKERQVFGKALSSFQNTQFKLAQLRAEIDVLQSYIDQSVISHNEGELTSVEAAKGKLLTTELQGKVVDECLQLHGGAGFMDEYPISRLYADARISRIFAGSSEIMKLIISRDVLCNGFISFNERGL